MEYFKKNIDKCLIYMFEHQKDIIKYIQCNVYVEVAQDKELKLVYDFLNQDHKEFLTLGYQKTVFEYEGTKYEMCYQILEVDNPKRVLLNYMWYQKV